MAAQFAAALLVAALLEDILPATVRIGYIAVSAFALLLQFLLHRTFAGDRHRRDHPMPWLARFAVAYAINGLILGLMIAAMVLLPREPVPLLALMVLLTMVASVSLTIAVHVGLSVMLIVLAVLPGVTVLLYEGGRDNLLLAGLGLVASLTLVSFSWRLYRYYNRSSQMVSRLRTMLQDRARVSADAEAAQQRLQSILDTAPFPIVVVRRGDGAFLYHNRLAGELFGIAGRAAGAGHSRYVLDAEHHARIFGDRKPEPDGEMQIATAAGRAIWATMASVPMQYAGDDAALVVVNDITERKASEARLREAQQRLSDALALAPDGVALYDEHERLVICNKAYADIITVPLAQTVGMSHDEVCDRCLLGRPAPAAAGVRTDYGEWAEHRRRTFKAAQGEPHIFFDTMSRRWQQIRDFRLSSGGTASLVTDISELKRQERELREANENLAHQAEMLAARTETLEAARKAAIKAHQEAEYANRAKSQFLAHMSHELRTPLNAIIGFSEIMALQLMGPSGVPQYDRYAGDILTAGKHLLSVIDDILDLSKVEAGKMRLLPEPVPWQRLAEQCVILLRPLAADRLVALIAQPVPAGTTLFADERLAKQMLVNLLSNSVKYTPSGGRVSFGCAPHADGGAVVTVEDTGMGMTEADIARALEPFGRIESALVSQMSGTGLGLPLVKALIELHGGRLEITSEPGRGTRARLYFPPPGKSPQAV
ncbi:PAS domain-containing sensor histidine kinase [Ferrovibrio sp.]|uniref:PAS domain-containing sensor histidine kinase n=1 Tax=Ferrovibrio sp. TaxID=1917215 RepID=UPI00311EC7F3